jgi:hypothetical protein
MEDVMMNLFTPPGLDVDGGGRTVGTNTISRMNSVVGTDCSRGNRRTTRTSKYGSCYWGDDYDEDEVETDSSSSGGSEEDSATVRKVCQLWKSKRRKEKLKAKRLQQEEASLYDKELQNAKEIALSIQRSFEKKFDENDESQRFERYGSRAHFMKYKER